MEHEYQILELDTIHILDGEVDVQILNGRLCKAVLLQKCPELGVFLFRFGSDDSVPVNEVGTDCISEARWSHVAEFLAGILCDGFRHCFSVR